jgi:hypothetical protein
MSENSRRHYECRSRIACELAADATSPTIAAIYLALAERYDLIAIQSSGSPAEKPKLRIVAS